MTTSTVVEYSFPWGVLFNTLLTDPDNCIQAGVCVEILSAAVVLWSPRHRAQGELLLRCCVRKVLQTRNGFYHLLEFCLTWRYKSFWLNVVIFYALLAGIHSIARFVHVPYLIMKIKKRRTFVGIFTVEYKAGNVVSAIIPQLRFMQARKWSVRCGGNRNKLPLGFAQ